MAKTRYMLMADSDTETTDDGVARIDIFTFPINEFRQTEVVLEWTLSDTNVYRFDQLIMDHYGATNYYLPMIKWLNGLFEMNDDKIGTKIKLYSKRDLDRFLREYILKLERS